MQELDKKIEKFDNDAVSLQCTWNMLQDMVGEES